MVVDRRWWDRAACLGEPVNKFFPGSHDHAGRRAALAVCADCPVKRECLDAALAAGDFDGVFGGTNGPERRRLAGRLVGVEELDCVVCGGVFVREASRQKYCSTECRRQFWLRRPHRKLVAA